MIDMIINDLYARLGVLDDEIRGETDDIIITGLESEREFINGKLYELGEI